VVLTAGFAQRADNFDAPTEHDAKSAVHFLGMGRKNSERHDDVVQISYRLHIRVRCSFLSEAAAGSKACLGPNARRQTDLGPGPVTSFSQTSTYPFFCQILLHVRKLLSYISTSLPLSSQLLSNPTLFSHFFVG
jgi:hypothetical protein